MDPNEALALVRDALATDDVRTARDAFTALDEWLCNGGFLPLDWAGAR